MLGTVGYMAPEMVRGQTVDARSDLFALGAVIYEMLAGRRAFERETAAETMTAILKEDLPELVGSRAEISPDRDRIVRHCLEKNPGEPRIATAELHRVRSRRALTIGRSGDSRQLVHSLRQPVRADGHALARLAHRWRAETRARRRCLCRFRTGRIDGDRTAAVGPVRPRVSNRAAERRAAGHVHAARVANRKPRRCLQLDDRSQYAKSGSAQREDLHTGRRVFNAPGAITVHDISADGDLLASFDRPSRRLEMLDGQGGDVAHDFSWKDGAFPVGLSDGHVMLFDQTGDSGGPRGSVYVWKPGAGAVEHLRRHGAGALT